MIKVSYLEIYNENIFDLLRDEYEEEQKMQIFEDVKNKEFVIKGCMEEYVESFEESMVIFEKGEVNRHFAETVFNHNSSRSHTLFRIFIKFIDSD